MKKLFLVFTLIFSVMSLYAAPAQNQPAAQPQATQPQTAQPQTAQQKTAAPKAYTFTEALIDIPIQPFVIQKLSDAELIDINPQALKAYENAVSAENQPNVMNNPADVVKAWNEVAKITQKNPFLYTAKTRIEEWNKCIELFNRHKENIDKLKTLLASSILAAEQKKGLLSKHLDEFGLAFGTQEVFNLANNVQGLDAALKETDFQAQIKEIKEKRCDKNSGKDCFECGKDYTQADSEKITLFTKACDLKFQPGCDEANKIKAAQEAEKARIAAEEKRKAEEFATKSYDLAEDAPNVITPFVLGTVSEQDVLNTDPQILKKFEDAVAKEKMKESIKTPGAMTLMWEEIAKVSEKNPFQPVAQTRAAQWREAAEKMYKHEADMTALKQNLNNGSVQPAQKTELSLKHLNEYGLSFGTMEIMNSIVSLTETAGNEDIKTKIKEIRKQRCDLNVAADCHSFAFNHAANEEEKTAYLKKACDLGSQLACENKPMPEILPAPEQQTASAAAEPEKKEPEKPKELTEEEKFKKELNDAGRRTRIAVATTTLVVGAVAGGLGGFSFYIMNGAKKDRDKYLNYYNYSETQADMDLYRKKTNDADKKRKKYLILGGVGAGVGAALIATGITLYCIEFKGEKEVKKKYNVSFGASPFDGTLQFALNW